MNKLINSHLSEVVPQPLHPLFSVSQVFSSSSMSYGRLAIQIESCAEGLSLFLINPSLARQRDEVRKQAEGDRDWV